MIGTDATAPYSQSYPLQQLSGPQTIQARVVDEKGLFGHAQAVDVIKNFGDLGIRIKPSFSDSTIRMGWNGFWSLSTSGNWLSMYPTSGYNDILFTLTTTSVQNSTSARVAQVRVEGYQGVQYFNITQDGIYLRATPLSKTKSPQAQIDSLAIESNAHWWADTSTTPAWIHFPRGAQGSNNTILKFALDTNVGQLRTTSITIRTLATSEVVEIRQDSIMVNFEKEWYTDSKQKFFNTTLQSNFELKSISGNEPWVSIALYPTGTYYLANVGVQANPGAARMAVLTLISGPKNFEIHLLQDSTASVLSVPGVVELPRQGGTFGIEITTNYAWSVSGTGAWLTQSKSPANEPNTLNIRATSNLNGPRVRLLQIRAGNKSAGILVRQRGYYESDRMISDTLYLDDENPIALLTVSSVNAFGIQANVPWLLFDPSSSEESTVVRIRSFYFAQKDGWAVATLAGEGFTHLLYIVHAGNPLAPEEITNIHTHMSISLDLYPNPASSALYLSCTVAIGSVRLIDALGKIVLQDYTKQSTFAIPLQVPQGLYILEAMGQKKENMNT